jgi:hypothetical protein
MTYRKRAVIAIGLLGLCLVALIAATSGSSGTTAELTRITSQRTSPMRQPATSTSLSAYFAVLNHRASAADDTTRAAAGALAHILSHEAHGALRLDYRAAREVRVRGVRIWIVPGAVGMCLYLPTELHASAVGQPGISACSTSLQGAIAGNLVTQTSEIQGIREYVTIGLLPNSASAIIFDTNGQPNVMTIVDNVYVYPDKRAHYLVLSHLPGGAINAINLNPAGAANNTATPPLR